MRLGHDDLQPLLSAGAGLARSNETLRQLRASTLSLARYCSSAEAMPPTAFAIYWSCAESLRASRQSRTAKFRSHMTASYIGSGTASTKSISISETCDAPTPVTTDAPTRSCSPSVSSQPSTSGCRPTREAARSGQPAAPVRLSPFAYPAASGGRDDQPQEDRAAVS